MTVEDMCISCPEQKNLLHILSTQLIHPHAVSVNGVPINEAAGAIALFLGTILSFQE